MTAAASFIEASSPHVMNTYARLPIALSYGQGCRVWDVNGKAYLDALGGIAVNTLGHNHPKLVPALQDQIARIIHSSNYYHVPNQEKLAAKLVELSGLTNVFFCSTGLEANEAALKLARKFGHDKGIERPEIVVYEKAFHGRSIATLSATGCASSASALVVPCWAWALAAWCWGLKSLGNGTPRWRTDLSSQSGTLMTHDESIALIRSLGAKFTPELKDAKIDLGTTFDDRFAKKAAAKRKGQAKKAGAAWAVVRGDDELEGGLAALKNMETGGQANGPLAELAGKLTVAEK